MALPTSATLNGREMRTLYGIEITNISPRGLGPVRRGSTPLGESSGRVGQVAFSDEQIISLTGQISGSDHAALMAFVAAFQRDIGMGRDGGRTFILRFEDTATEFICQYAGGWNLGPISDKGLFKQKIATFNVQLAVQSGYGVGAWNSFLTGWTGLSTKRTVYVPLTNSDVPVRPQIVVTNTSATPVTAVTLRSFAKRRIQRNLTGTMSSAFAPTDGAFRRGLLMSTGTHTYSFANDTLWPSTLGWTILFRFKRTFTASNRTFWQTSNGTDKLHWEPATDELTLDLGGTAVVKYANALASLPTGSFVQVACKLTPEGQTSLLGFPDIMVDQTLGTRQFGGSIGAAADPGANLYFGTSNTGTNRAEGVFDEIIIFNHALPDEEIRRWAQARPLTSMEGVCLYVNFENGVNGIGLSNLDMTFSGISLTQNDSLCIDCERQTAKKITSGFGVTDQLSLFSGEFMELEPGDNMIQLLVTGGAASNNNLQFHFNDRKAA